MVKVKNLADAQIGDFINYKNKLSIICAITRKGESFIIQLDDKRIIEESGKNHQEIFRMVDKF